jgi:hypothetical protein
MLARGRRQEALATLDAMVPTLRAQGARRLLRRVLEVRGEVLA